MKCDIERQLSRLVGISLSSIGRASNMTWFSFGKQTIVKDRFGKDRTIGEFALHVHCSWRLIKGNKILLASRDIYVPDSRSSTQNDDFDWSVVGNSGFDERTKQLFEQQDVRAVIQEIRSDNFGGAVLMLSNGVSIDIFPDQSGQTEFWRLFRPGDSSEHFVVTSNGVELE